MTADGKTVKPFSTRFIEDGSQVLLELTNTSDQPLNCVEILTIFLKDEGTVGGPSRVNIKFEAVKSIQPKAKVVMSHKTWIDGKPVAPQQDQLARLSAITGAAMPYVLDISWEDGQGKSRFQRVPVGH